MAGSFCGLLLALCQGFVKAGVPDTPAFLPFGYLGGPRRVVPVESDVELH